MDKDQQETLLEQLESAKYAAEPFETLHAIARELRDDGVSQVELWRLFSDLAEPHRRDSDRSFYQATRDTVDCIWSGNDSSLDLFDGEMTRATIWKNAIRHRDLWPFLVVLLCGASIASLVACILGVLEFRVIIGALGAGMTVFLVHALWTGRMGGTYRETDARGYWIEVFFFALRIGICLVAFLLL